MSTFWDHCTLHKVKVLTCISILGTRCCDYVCNWLSSWCKLKPTGVHLIFRVTAHIRWATNQTHCQCCQWSHKEDGGIPKDNARYSFVKREFWSEWDIVMWRLVFSMSTFAPRLDLQNSIFNLPPRKLKQSRLDNPTLLISWSYYTVSLIFHKLI